MTSPDEADVVLPPRTEPSTSGPIVTWRDFLIQLVIVTLGVLIALFFQGMVDWRRDEALVREARTQVRQELLDNARELNSEIAGLERRKTRLDTCLRFANDLLATGKTEIQSIDLGLSFAELGSASWQGAERTGALALMNYRDVQALSKVYDLQGLYVAEQRRALDRVASALTGVTGDPAKAARADLEAFRHDVLALEASLLIEGQLAEQLSRAYTATIAEIFPSR